MPILAMGVESWAPIIAAIAVLLTAIGMGAKGLSVINSLNGAVSELTKKVTELDGGFTRHTSLELGALIHVNPEIAKKANDDLTKWQEKMERKLDDVLKEVMRSRMGIKET